MTPGIAAEKLPTPKASTLIATSSSVRFDRAAANRTNPAADDDGAAGQEKGCVDQRPKPGREFAGDEPQHRERDEDQPSDDGGQSEAVAGAVRLLRVPRDEREQKVHAASADEHGDVRSGDRRVLYRPDVDQGRLAAQLGGSPDAEQEH